MSGRKESLTLRVSEGDHGWWCIAYWDEGDWEGSAQNGAGSFASAEEAFAYLLEHTKRTAKWPLAAEESPGDA